MLFQRVHPFARTLEGGCVCVIVSLVCGCACEWLACMFVYISVHGQFVCVFGYGWAWADRESIELILEQSNTELLCGAGMSEAAEPSDEQLKLKEYICYRIVVQLYNTCQFSPVICRLCWSLMAYIQQTYRGLFSESCSTVTSCNGGDKRGETEPWPCSKCVTHAASTVSYWRPVWWCSLWIIVMLSQIFVAE